MPPICRNNERAILDPDIKANIFITVRGSSFAATKNQIQNKNYLLTSRRAVPGDTKAPYLGFRLACHL
jgi:hypothetical protein